MARTYRRRYGRRRFRRRRLRSFRRSRYRRRSFRRSRRTGSRRRPFVVRNAAGNSIRGSQTSALTMIRHSRGISVPKDLNWDINRCSGAFRTSSSVGAQSAFSRSFLQGGATVYTGSERVDVGTGYGSDLEAHSADLPDNPYYRRMMLKSELRLQFTSFATVVTKCTLYILRARRNIGSNPGSGYFDLRAVYPHQLWSYLTLTSTQGGNPPSSYTDLGATPYATPDFGTYWRIIKTRRFMLDPGATCQHRIISFEYYMYNWLKLGLGFAGNDSADIVMKDRTYAFMLVFHGSAAADNENAAAVNVAASSVACTWDFAMWTAPAQHPQASSMNWGNDLDPLRGVANRIVNDDSGHGEVPDII